MLQTEMIGKVAMNYRHYTGTDLYSDGAVEDELLQIVMNHHPSEFADIIEEKASWPVFYHLSELRGNIVDWIPIAPGAKVLEVGAGCGAVTGALAAKGAQLTCVELSKKRSLINAYRNRERDGITIYVSNFRDIEPELDRSFDFIFLIGVFEYGASYIGGDHPYETFLYMLQRHLAPGGRIVIAIENRLGMKYFAGCKEDHAARYFAGLEGYRPQDPARTFSRSTLVRMMRSAGITDYHFYYPYPDYKFTMMLHSDQYLPRPGEFADNVRNFDADRMVLFNEKYALDAMVADRMYPDFANSFEIVIGPPIPTIYVKFSNDRADEFKIRTDIVLDSLGRVQIHKHPLSYAAREHVRGMSDAYSTLTDRYTGGDIAINDCQLDQTSDAAIFSFVNGVTLASLLDGCIARGDMAGFDTLFKEYVRRISYREDYPAADYDLIFSNILVNGPVWTVIDYEWTYGKRIATRDIAFRALYCYVLEDERRRVIDVNRFYNALGLDAAAVEQLTKEEAAFQKYVTGGRKALVEIWRMLGFKASAPEELKQPAHREDEIQVYVDRGEGYSEENSFFPDARYDRNRNVTLQISFEAGMKSVRVDPGFTPCILTIKQIDWNGKSISDDGRLMNYRPNGAWLSDDSIVFNTEDPNIEFIPAETELHDRRGNTLTLTYSMVSVPQDVADNLFAYQVVDTPEEAQEVVPFTLPPQPQEEKEEPQKEAVSRDTIQIPLPAFLRQPVTVQASRERARLEEEEDTEDDVYEPDEGYAEEEEEAVYASSQGLSMPAFLQQYRTDGGERERTAPPRVTGAPRAPRPTGPAYEAPAESRFAAEYRRQKQMRREEEMQRASYRYAESRAEEEEDAYEEPFEEEADDDEYDDYADDDGFGAFEDFDDDDFADDEEYGLFGRLRRKRR